MSVTPAPVVLVVDHDRSGRHATARLLARVGYHVLAAADGISALAQASGVKLTAAVLDPMAIDGLELAARLRAVWPEVLLVAVTGWRGTEVSRWLTEAGFDTVLFHPAHPDALLSVFRAPF